jgi:hypothetical protein
MNATKKTAKTAGWQYLLLAITGIFSLMYVPSTLIEFGDATTTAKNIATSALLFRAGILVGLISQIVFVFLVLTLFRLFKEINRRHAALMVALVVVSATAGFIVTLNFLVVSILLSDADFLSVFDKSQLDALAYLFLRLHSQALLGVQIFWGLWLFPFGLLVFRSHFIPKIFGVLLIIAGVGYVLDSVAFFLLPQYKDALTPFFTIMEIGELPIIFWLLIVGATTPTQEQKIQL